MSFLTSLFGTDKPQVTQIGTVLELTNYAASLASNLTDVDPYLDDVRLITANRGPDESLSPDDTKALIAVYLRIEEYLMTKEPVRSFSKEGLRSHIMPELLQQIENYDVNLKKEDNA